jgi:GntR family transcriptional repressor for pyruvate dehydrogenase complex
MSRPPAAAPGLTRVTPRAPAHAQCEAQLRHAIVAGHYVAGERLPSERVLAEQLGVSRLTLRAALATLAAAGLVSVRHGSGYRVRDARQHGGLDLLPTLLAQATSPRELAVVVDDLLAVRRGLARTVLERLVEQPPVAAARRELERAVDALAAAGGDPTAAAHADRAVFASLLTAAGGVVLPLCLNPVIAQLVEHPTLRAAIYRDVDLNVAAWRALLEFVRAPRRAAIEPLLEALASHDAGTVDALRATRRPRRAGGAS